MEGSIIKKELEFNGARANIPAYDIPQGNRGLIHIWARNDTDTTQSLGISWEVTDPDGLIVETYADWSHGHGPGDDHEFIGGRFDLNKEGYYILNLALRMGDNVLVAAYSGVLCTVVEERVLDFDLTKPISSQTITPPGVSITIAAPITSRCSETVVASAKIIIYEGSILGGPGTEIVSYTTPPFTITPNQTKNLGIIHTTVEGTIDRRDVGVEIYVDGELIREQTWNDIYYVEADLKVLHQQILGEPDGGTIEFDPMPIDAESHYYKGTVVNLRAVVNTGFRFVMWRGEVDNELSTLLTNTVTMSENRLVKAEFALAEVEQFYPLEIDITPPEGGYVTTNPPPADITNHFVSGSVGKFPEGTRVQVAAYPNTGYEFYKWTDEIQGGTSYSNPEWVKDLMDEHRAVKAHFRQTEVPPECSVAADCGVGYVCVNGVCVPEEEAEPEGKGFPLLPAILIGGGVALAVLTVIPKKR